MSAKSKNNLTQPPPPVKAVDYIRVSTQEQAEHGVSLSEQIERLHALAKMEGWQEIGTYIDEGYSGGTDNRPELQRLLNDAQAGLFNLVAVTKIDRFFRNTRLLLNYVHELEECGVAFVAQAEGIDTRNPGSGKLVLNMLGSIAEWERERIGDRISDFRQHLAGKGQWSSGKPPFGYRFNKQTKQLVIDPLEAEAVRFVFNTYVNKEVGIIKTAEIATSEGVALPRSGRRRHDIWTQSGVRFVLTQSAYKGGPNEGWQFKCPPIVTPELWDAAQRQLDGNRHFRVTDNHSPFAGLLRCGLCGHTLRIGYNHKTKWQARQVWECPGRLKVTHLDSSPRCTLPRFLSNTLEEQLTDRVAEIFGDPDTLAKYVSETLGSLEKEKALLERKLRPLRSDTKRIHEAMEKADTMFQLSRLSKEDYSARLAGLRKRLSELERQSDAADPLLLKQLASNEKALNYYRTQLTHFKEQEVWLRSRIDRLPMVTSPVDDAGRPMSPLYMSLNPPVSKAQRDRFINDILVGSILGPADTPEETRPGQRGERTNGVSKYLRDFGLFVYVHPKKLEIKGVMRQSNIIANYKSGRYQQFQ
ncbi:recombinase family protein [Chloroflexota bacterium]